MNLEDYEVLWRVGPGRLLFHPPLPAAARGSGHTRQGVGFQPQGLWQTYPLSTRIPLLSLLAVTGSPSLTPWSWAGGMISSGNRLWAEVLRVALRLERLFADVRPPLCSSLARGSQNSGAGGVLLAWVSE